MVLIKMSSNVGHVTNTYRTPEQNNTRPIKQAVIRRPVLPPTSFENPILLSSPSSSDDERRNHATPPPIGSSRSSSNRTPPTSGGSTRSGKFCLTGEFSSFDSDVFVSGTSDSSSEDEAMSCQPLSELRNLITKKNRVIPTATLPDDDDDVALVVLSDCTSDESSDSSSDPLFKPPSSLTSNLASYSKRDQPQSLTIQIPLHLVTVPKPSLPSQKFKRPFPLSHFATTKKRAINDSNHTMTTPTSVTLPKPPPISLKLTKSPTGSSWRSTTPIDSPSPHKHMTNNEMMTAGKTSPKKTSPKKTSPSKASPGHKSRTLNSQSVIVKAQTHNECPAIVQSSGTQNEHLLQSEIARTETENISLNSIKTNGSGLHDDDINSVTSNSSSLTTTSSNPVVTTNGYVTTTKTNKVPSKSNLNKRRNKTPKPVTNIKHVKSTICFEKLFEHCSTDLVQVQGELRPLHSLSLKNVDKIPSNHPIHTWTLGKPVPKLRQPYKSSPFGSS